MYSIALGKTGNAPTFWKSEADRLYGLGPRIRAVLAKRDRRTDESPFGATLSGFGTKADRIQQRTEALRQSHWSTP